MRILRCVLPRFQRFLTRPSQYLDFGEITCGSDENFNIHNVTAVEIEQIPFYMYCSQFIVRTENILFMVRSSRERSYMRKDDGYFLHLR